MKVRLVMRLGCGACGSVLTTPLYAHDEGPDGPTKWYVPLSQPLIVTWHRSHHQPVMEPTGRVLSA